MDEQNLTPFELSLSARLRPYAERAVVPVDAAEVARAVASAHPRAGARWNLLIVRRSVQFAMILGLLVLATVAAALIAGALRPPSELGSNGLITFATNGRIAVANPDGSDVRILTDGGEGVYFPTWSPDGSSIAFWSEPPNLSPASLTLLDPGTGSRTVITRLNPQSRPAPISWAPDSQRIAFPAYSEHASAEVLVVNVDGTNLRSLAPDLQASDPAWSPDGQQIAFRGIDPAELDIVALYVADDTGVRELFRVNERPSSDQNAMGVQLDWSPDGRQIAYASKGFSAAGGYVIAVADVATGATHDLAPGSAGYYDTLPVWSPDGRWIAFSREDQTNPNRVALIRPDGSDVRVLTGAITAQSTLSWSPDGTRIVAYNADRTQVLVLPIDGTEPLTIPASGANTTPSWQRLPR
jgi:Tol biopolymer transport system component